MRADREGEDVRPFPAGGKNPSSLASIHGGARRADGSRVYLLSAVEHGSRIPLGQVLAGSKGFEVAAFAAVVDRIELSGVVVTAAQPSRMPLSSAVVVAMAVGRTPDRAARSPAPQVTATVSIPAALPASTSTTASPM